MTDRAGPVNLRSGPAPPSLARPETGQPRELAKDVMQSWRDIGWSVMVAGMLAALLPHGATAASGSPAPRSKPEVRSHAYYVLDEKGATVLAARHERTPVPIASITKLMTALVVLEAGQPMDEVLSITREDLNGTIGGSSRIPKGARLTRSDMLRLR
jgi:serine-type D-Ala-D-Ala endopeptidase (penicillin-binding protein 7)